MLEIVVTQITEKIGKIEEKGEKPANGMGIKNLKGKGIWEKVYFDEDLMRLRQVNRKISGH